MHPNQTKNTRTRIIDATITLSSRYGLSGLSIRKITNEVGIKESSLYNHFRNKESLLNAILEEAERELKSWTLPVEAIDKTLLANGPEGFLRKGLMRYKEYWDDPRRARIWSLMMMEQYRNERVASIILAETQRIIGFNETAFLRMVDRGFIRPYNPHFLSELFSHTLLSLHREYAVRVLHNRNPDEIEHRMFEWIRHFVDMIGR